MIRNIAIVFLLAVVSLATFNSCKDKEEKTDDTPAQIAGSAQAPASTDTLTTMPEEEIVPEPPKKADMCFDDFVFSFMKTPKFQKNRIAFPLAYTIDGVQKTITREEWTFDRMYSAHETYTLIFDSMDAEKAAKDTTLRAVTVEELDLDTHHTKNYCFKQIEGAWRLTSISEMPMDDSENNDFYTFYHSFATDKTFRDAHITPLLNYSTYDEDSFDTIKGVIDADQFDDFAPELPKTHITNIQYGQNYKKSDTRVLSLRALAGGMESTLVFKKDNGTWRLTELNN